MTNLKCIVIILIAKLSIKQSNMEKILMNSYFVDNLL